MSWAARSRFYRQFGLLVRSGMTAERALPLAGAAAGGGYGTRATAWARACGQGQPLAAQLGDEPPTVRALVQAGERTGRLPEVCDRIADLTDEAIQLRQRVISKLAYPTFLLHVALIVPALPGVVLGTSPLVALLAGPAVLWLVLGSLALLAKAGLAGGVVGRLALLPPLRFLVLPTLADRVCLVTGAAHGAGILHRSALELAAAACGNRTLEGRLREAARDLEDHRLPDLATAMAQAGLDPTTVNLVAAAEAGGRLEEGLARAALVNRQAFSLRADWTARLATGTIIALVMLTVAVTVVTMWQRVYAGPLQAVEEDSSS